MKWNILIDTDTCKKFMVNKGIQDYCTISKWSLKKNIDVNQKENTNVKQNF